MQCVSSGSFNEAAAQVPTVSAGGVPSPVWVIAIVRRNSEKVCRDQLLAEGVEAYVATQTLLVRHSKKRPRPVEYVRLPAKVFVRLRFSHPGEHTAFCMSHPYIHQFMTDPARSLKSTGVPNLAEVHDGELQRLRDVLNDTTHEVTFGELGADFTVETPVRVAFGPLRDTLGTLARRNGKSYFVVQTQFLNCARILVSPDEIIPLGR